MEQLLESGTQLHPSTTTGHVVTSETLTFLQAQKKQKVAKAADAETRGQALKERRAELIVSHKADGEKVLAVAQGVNGQTAWKALNKPVLDGAFRSWGGVVSALADSKKPTLIAAIQPLLAIKMAGGNVAEEKEHEDAEDDE
jgi:hypothetical protein